MEPKTYIIIGAAVFLVLLLLYLALTADFRKKQKALARVLSAYGSEPIREYTTEELEKIKKYFLSVHDGDTFAIDDITWNDLDLDTMYAAMNHTFSSPGEEELYRMLREPVFTEEEIMKRADLIAFFRDNEKTRLEFSVEYACIGRTRKYSLIECLNGFRDLKLKDDIGYILHILLIIIAVIVSVIKPFIGIIAIIGVLAFNLATYYKTKMEVEQYYASLSMIAYIVKHAEHFEKFRDSRLAPYVADLTRALNPLRSLKRDVKWLGASVQNQLSANPLLLLVDYLRMSTHLDFIAFNRMVRTVREHEESVKSLLHTVGYMEACIAIGSFRETLPFYTEAEFEPRSRTFSLKDAYHPLIQNPVANSVDATRSVLITGSNASGKSTFLRTAAMCALFAETICTVPAHSLKTGFFRVFSSMALQDNLSSGESYYIVEIKSIKRIMDALGGEVPVLAFVDEVLRGTNTVERISASSQILKSLAEKRALVFAATHDVELTEMLESHYENKHFEEEVDGDTVRFNYQLKDGRATTRNAIKLLRVMGYSPEVIEKAEETAEHFTKENEWKLL